MSAESKVAARGGDLREESMGALIGVRMRPGCRAAGGSAGPDMSSKSNRLGGVRELWYGPVVSGLLVTPSNSADGRGAVADLIGGPILGTPKLLLPDFEPPTTPGVVVCERNALTLNPAE